MVKWWPLNRLFLKIKSKSLILMNFTSEFVDFISKRGEFRDLLLSLVSLQQPEYLQQPE